MTFIIMNFFNKNTIIIISPYVKYIYIFLNFNIDISNYSLYWIYLYTDCRTTISDLIDKLK